MPQHLTYTLRTLVISFLILFSLRSVAQNPIELHGTIVTENQVTVSWLVDCDELNPPEEVFIRYNRAVVLSNEGDVWLRSDTVKYTDGRINLNDLKPVSNYTFQLGYLYPDSSEADSNGVVWTARERFKTDIPWGITRFLMMIGSLCLFIYGMKTMSEGVQATAGGKLRSILNFMTRNKFTGIFSGFTLTGLLQSSTATSVMTVSFVNAGLISLAQSVGIMMGANIGTTITGWLVSYFGFRVDITIYALIIFALATPLLLIKRTEVRSWSTALIGFALLFMGLGFLKDTVPTFTENSALVQFFISYSETPFLGTLMFIFLGMVVTIVVQSSSTAMTLTMTLCATGVIPFDVAAAMILGENIGTTATAEIAALVGNVHAKRSARIHTLFNVIGVCWMVFLLPFVLQIIGSYLPVDPFEKSEAGRQSATMALAAFHSIFNVANLLLLVWFSPQLIKLATWTVPSRGGEDEEFRLEFINSSIHLSEISLIEVKREVSKFGQVTAKMSGFVQKLLTETEHTEQHVLHTKIRKYEKITDRLEIEIAQYCSRLSRTELSKTASERVRSILSISADLERIGDIFYQMSSALERKSESKIWFTPGQRQKLMEMFRLVNQILALMQRNLEADEDSDVNLVEAKRLEKNLDEMRKRMKQEYIAKLESGRYNLRSGTVYNDLSSSLEKVGDHALNVTEALSGKI